jgi:uncharacterized membrane-anchored protein YhcB (DUF1043 family)
MSEMTLPTIIGLVLGVAIGTLIVYFDIGVI